MLRGFYTAASGMITQQRQQEALANNLANVNTPGYKADQTIQRSFPELLLQQVHAQRLPVQRNFRAPINRPIGSLHTGVYAQEMVPDYSQGDLKETHLPTDVAIVTTELPDETGNVFFSIQNEDGDIRLTRNGNFTVDGYGMLTTNEGYYVLDHNNEQIAVDNLDFTVSPEGNLITSEGEIIPLGLVYVSDVNDLSKEGNDLYEGESEAVPANAQYQVYQGYLERSNVDTIQTMTSMMEAYRMFEFNQRMLRMIDQNMEIAVNDIGKIT
ncbi:MAG TPA: flagellar hook-basal body protein [Bacillota bacterium]|nr:flagellar hook-basal body protein [Bacillota bacterium]